MRPVDYNELWVDLGDSYQSLRGTVKVLRLAQASVRGEGHYARLREQVRRVAEGRDHATDSGKERSYQFDTIPQSQMERIKNWDFDFGKGSPIFTNCSAWLIFYDQ